MSRSKSSRRQNIAQTNVLENEKPHFDWALPALIATYIFLTALLIFSIPIGSAPDESAHLDYVKYIADKGRFPVFQTTPAPGYGYEFHQPPLYYLLCAPLWKIGGVLACRLFSLLCGSLTLLLLWQSVAHFFRGHEDRRTLQILAVGLCALWPMHQGVGASAGNDALAGLLAASIFYLIAKRADSEHSPRAFLIWSAGIGFCFGLGMLTKTTIFILGAVAFGAIISFWLQADKSRRGGVFLPVATFVLTASVICGWWLFRNQMLYGDPLAAGEFQRAFSQSSRGPSWFFERGISTLIYFEMVVLFLFCSAWGILGGPNSAQETMSRAMVFGVPNGRTDVWFAVTFLILCALACAISLFGWKSRRVLPLPASAAAKGVLCWLLGLTLVTIAWVIFNTRYFQVQARYFHPALLPLCFFFAIGWRGALGKGRVLKIATIAFGGVLLLVTLWNAFVWKTLV